MGPDIAQEPWSNGREPMDGSFFPDEFNRTSTMISRLALFISILTFIWIPRCALADVQFDSIELAQDQPFMSEIPKLKDKSLVCDVTSIYWALIAQMKIRGSGLYRLSGQPALYQVVARDPLGRDIVAHDGATLLRLAQMGQAEHPRRFDFEIRMGDLCLANKDKQFAPDEFLEYVQTLRMAVATVPIAR